MLSSAIMFGENIADLLPFLLLIVVFWLLIIRPARKRQADFRAVQASVQPGQKVLLTSGIFGTIAAVDEEKVSVEVAANTVIQVHRGAIQRILDADITE